MNMRTTRRSLLATSASIALALSMSGSAMSQEQVTLTFLIDTSADTVAEAEQLVADFQAKNPNITIEIETRPGGGEGDNIVKTRLATGEMTDIFLYNTGSLFQAINPQRNLVELTDEPFQTNVLDSFKSVVTSNNGIYGAPIETAMGGGVLYNRKIYADLGLSVPKSWSEFMDNNAKIKAAGIDPVIQTFNTTWTSQLFVLADFYNVQIAEPDFAVNYTANKAKYASTPAALKSFERQEDIFNSDYLNADFGAATFEDGLRMLALAEGAHFPMLTFAVGAIGENYPEKLDDIGFFAMPGDDADKNGLTVWMPPALYIPQTTEHVEEAKLFLNFVASVEGCESQLVAVGATGPFLVKGCALPDEVPPAVADLLPYFQTDGATAPALEFLSPIKGPSLEQITVEVGSGFRSAADGAALYDDDVKKQALQLGIEGW